jgi:glycosyltransferase involved in cell wall biosynthesis
MRVGLLAPPFERIPPSRYGGTERVIATLADTLVARGHDVALFASADSSTAARLVPVVEQPVWADSRYSDPMLFLPLAVGRAYAAAPDLDIMHSHVEEWAYPTARLSQVPTVTTLHWRLDRPELQAVYREFREQALVSVSDAQRAPLPGAAWIATVHHGLPTSLYRPGTTPGSFLLFCGRFSPEKGLADAIEVALATGLPLRVAGRHPARGSSHPAVRAEREYYEAVLAPRLGHPLIEYIGEVGEREKQELYAGALALLFPIHWPEPFGLVMIEALACGTPVLARPRGAVPEVITDGVTGFHCETVDDFVRAVGRLGDIERGACRTEFERRFSAERMAAQYEAVYARVVERARGGDGPAASTSPRRQPLLAAGADHGTAGVTTRAGNGAASPAGADAAPGRTLPASPRPGGVARRRGTSS